MDMDSRRAFLKKSASVAGAIAGGAAFAVSRPARAMSKPVDPKDYPWSVDVGEPAIVTLYLVGGYPAFGANPAAFDISLGELLYDKTLAATLDHMVKKLAYAKTSNASDLAKLKTLLGSVADVDALYGYLQTAQTHVAAHAALTSYMDYAMAYVNDPGNGKPYWPTNVRDALKNVHQYISIPLIHVNRDAATVFHSHQDDVKQKGAQRPVHHLFTRGIRGSAMERIERLMWQEARNAGLLWCTPYPVSKQSVADLDALFKGRYEGQGIVNNARCVNGVCVAESGQYCQMVGNECNAMS